MLAYTPSDEYGQLDRQIRIRPGKYLTKHMPWLSSQQVEEAVSLWKGAEVHTLQIATTPEDISWVYEHGPRSCMSGDTDFGDLPHHPAYVYGAGDLGVAYFRLHGDDVEDHNRPVAARTICWPAKEIYYDSAYGDYRTLHWLLKQEGFEKGTADDFRGAKILRVPIPTENNQFLMPYMDCTQDVTDFGKYFRIGASFREGGDIYSACSTAGVACIYARCCDCDETIPYGDVFTYHPENADYCGPCFDRYFNYCAYCGEYNPAEVCQFEDILDRYICDTCRPNQLFYCDVCGGVERIQNRSRQFEWTCISCIDELETDYPPVIDPVLETHTPGLPGLGVEGDESV
jgi:hypothetical protein